tara:strand:- start:2196 stop:2741 length:546 start_codon:yes stop_codon:yes gene_type:complete
MSRLFGPIKQIGFVVGNLEEALAYWTETLGIGPFFVIRHLPLEKFWYRGEPSTPPDLALAIASSGELQVELIYQYDKHPSAFLDCLQARGDGLQHASAWVDRKGYEKNVAQLKESGVPLAHEGWLKNDGPRFAFFATDMKAGGFQYEVSDVADPQFSALGETIREAANGWDGSQAIRDLTL